MALEPDVARHVVTCSPARYAPPMNRTPKTLTPALRRRPLTAIFALVLALLLATACADTEVPLGPMPDTGSTDAALPDAGPSAEPFPASCDLVAQDCPTRQAGPTACVLPSGDGLPRCTLLSDTRQDGEACDAHNECDAGMVCKRSAGEEQPHCRHVCDAAELESCPANLWCSGTLPGQAELGTCEPAASPCDLLQQDCPSGADCVVRTHPTTGERGAFCGRAGLITTGKPCGGDLGLCEAGTICVRPRAGEDASCQRVCINDFNCPAEGESCDGQVDTPPVSFCRT